MSACLRVALFILGALAAVPASAQYARRPGAVYEVPPPTEARGCYYWRGREFCGNYCYWEINGKRYCQQRLRDAYSQAAPEHVYEAEPRPYGYRLK